MAEQFHRKARDWAIDQIERIQFDLAPNTYALESMSLLQANDRVQRLYGHRSTLNMLWSRWAHDTEIRRNIQLTQLELRQRINETRAHCDTLRSDAQRQREQNAIRSRTQAKQPKKVKQAKPIAPRRSELAYKPVVRAEPPRLAPTFRPMNRAPAPPVRKLSWKVLGEQGMHAFKDVLHFVEAQQREAKGYTYDIERLHKIHRLKPSSVYVGRDEFDGYVVFVFKDQQLALLECPVVGNALYVLRGSWQLLARKSKAELLEDTTDAVTRIVHVGNWFERVEKTLTTSPVRTPSAATP